jgi:hypothetical protein
MPLALSDEELSHVMTACQPLAPNMRSAFLAEVASALSACPEIGPGSVHRAVRAAQRKFFDPPILNHTPGSQSKYR